MQVIVWESENFVCSFCFAASLTADMKFKKHSVEFLQLDFDGKSPHLAAF